MLTEWTKKLGQKHLVRDDDHTTICGMPLLGNNYAKVLADTEKKDCERCVALLGWVSVQA